MEMDAETKRRIEAVVVEILNSVNLEQTSEYMVRAAASKRLGIDLSFSDRRRFVSGVIESFLQSNPEDRHAAEAEAAAAADEAAKKIRGEKEYNRLSSKERVMIQGFRGKTLVSIAEYHEKDGKKMSSSKGISSALEQWEAFSKAIPAVEDATIKKLEESD